jgi:GT2 family glycosyltransferase
VVTLSVIIVSWNTCQLLATCLDAIASSLAHGDERAPQDMTVEIIVVDNGSTDGTLEMLRSDYPHVRVIENTANVGFARANNQGLGISRGRYVLLLNSDAFLRGPALARLVDFMAAHPQAGAAGPRLYYEDDSLQRSCTSFPTLVTEFYAAVGLDRLFPRSPLFGRYRMTYWDMRDERQVDVVMGACLIIRRDALDHIGALDERFFFTSEEVDWCYRLCRAGWRVYFVPDAEATHLWGGTSRVLPVQTLVQLYHNRLLFFRKHYSPLTATAYKGVLALACVLRLTAFPFAVLACLPAAALSRAGRTPGRRGIARLQQIRAKRAGYAALLRRLRRL